MRTNLEDGLASEGSHALRQYRIKVSGKSYEVSVFSLVSSDNKYLTERLSLSKAEFKLYHGLYPDETPTVLKTIFDKETNEMFCVVLGKNLDMRSFKMGVGSNFARSGILKDNIEEV